MSRTHLFALAATLILGGPLAPPASAQEALELTAYGVRAGASLDGDLLQVLVGGQVDLGRPWENVRVQPFLTLGAGDDALSLLLAGEVHYLFPVDPNRSRVDPYAGGGIGLHHVNFDDGPDDDDDATELALTLTAGVDIPMRRWWGYFAEARFLLADNSVFRLEGGINWTN